jgi:hypothetical protein
LAGGFVLSAESARSKRRPASADAWLAKGAGGFDARGGGGGIVLAFG